VRLYPKAAVLAEFERNPKAARGLHGDARAGKQRNMCSTRYRVRHLPGSPARMREP
jgi:hypothetical protein